MDTEPIPPSGVRVTGEGFDLIVDDILTQDYMDQHGCWVWTFPVVAEWFEMIEAGTLTVTVAVLPPNTAVGAVPATLPVRAMEMWAKQQAILAAQQR